MTEETKQPEITGELQVNDGKFKPGVSGNPEGRPAGSKNFSTWFKLAIEKIAKTEEIDIDSAEVQLIVMAYKEARKGNFNFYKDIIDRVYGKPKDVVDLESTSLVELIMRIKKDEQ